MNSFVRWKGVERMGDMMESGAAGHSRDTRGTQMGHSFLRVCFAQSEVRDEVTKNESGAREKKMGGERVPFGMRVRRGRSAEGFNARASSGRSALRTLTACG